VGIRVLIIAFACHPKEGSEGGVGWKTVQLLGREHRVFVLTHLRGRNPISEAQDNLRNEAGVKFFYCGKEFKWHSNRMIARWQSWLEYVLWLRAASKEVPKICNLHGIELIHHLTITTWRCSPVLGPSGTPLVWGPLGGAALYPWRLLGMMSLSAAFFEILRNIFSTASLYNPFLRRGSRRASHIIGSSREAVKWMKKLAGSKVPISKLSATFFSEEQACAFTKSFTQRQPDAPLRAFAGGNLIGSKGVGFALHALRVARDRGVFIPYTIASYGPETCFLRKMAEKLGLKDQVFFHPGFFGQEYYKALAEHSVYLLPSFREGSPGTICEAMFTGQVPVVVQASAQGEIVTSACGFAVPLGSADAIVCGLAEALVQLARNGDLKKSLSVGAHERVSSLYRSSVFLESVGHIYASALSRA